MKKKSLIIIVITSLSMSLNLNSQVGGNQIYNNNNKNRSYNYNRKPIEKTSIYSTDSTLVVTAKVLLNQKADYYLITIGANQLGKTVIEVNQKINKRIDNVKQKLNLLDISNDEIYVDFISQTKQYDFKITGREVNEYFDGFNIRKNISPTCRIFYRIFVICGHLFSNIKNNSLFNFKLYYKKIYNQNIT